MELPAAPALTLDLSSEIITGCIDGKRYQYGTTGTTWTSATTANNSFKITSVISTSNAITLYVRKAATAIRDILR
jgi:hypothetical protein